MRILQLDLGGQRIEFHPYVTVLRGLDDGLRTRLIDALAAVSVGEPSARGLVEAHGVVLDLNRESLELLDLPGDRNGSVDIVVRRDQLPGVAPVTSSGRGQLERARAEAADRLARAEASADRAKIAMLASLEALTDPSGRSNVDETSGLDAPRAELTRLS
ncbi:MAG TPA: hypothetical protein VGZ52_05085, partial [Acidimicrobiales bacterium]|nr:hypothetical protein [Acidimicrobiales bacterium]